MNSIEIGLLTPSFLRTKDKGKAILELMLEVLPKYSPEKFNAHEPINLPFDSSNIDSALELWCDGFLWKRKKPNVQGQVTFGRSYKIHDGIFLSLKGKDFRFDVIDEFVNRFNCLFRVDFAYIHTKNDEDMQDLNFYKNCIMPFNQGLNTHVLKKYIPCLCWAMYFGKPYIELFGKETLLSSPVFQTQDYGDIVSTRVTESVDEVDKDYASFQKIRSKAIEHLNGNSNAFYSQELTNYDKPEFMLLD